MVTTRTLGWLAMAVLWGMLVLAPAAHAFAPTGACCFANRNCQDLMSTQCDTQNGDFIGEGTSCQTINCAAPLAVPMLSIFGLVAVFGALGAFGVYRLTFGRRAP